jgi:hypothetical protein
MSVQEDAILELELFETRSASASASANRMKIPALTALSCTSLFDRNADQPSAFT